MIGATRHRRFGLAQAFAIVAMLAILVRALTPQGFMLAPAQSDNGWVAIRLCSGHGPVDALIDLKTGAIVDQAAKNAGGSGKAPQRSDAPCLFAAIAHLAAPVSPLALSVQFLSNARIAFVNFVIAPGVGLAAPPPWSTGPPLRT